MNRLLQFFGFGWRRLQKERNDRVINMYRNRARKLAEAFPERAERLLWEIDEVAEMLKFEEKKHDLPKMW